MEQVGVRPLVRGQTSVRAGRGGRPRSTQGTGRGALERPGQRQQQVVCLVEDHLLRPCQRRAGIHAELLHQAGARPPPRSESIGLPVAAVQREHQPDPPTLAKRVCGNQRLQLRHELAVLAKVKVDVDPGLESRRLHVCQAPPLAVRPAGGPPVLEGFASPVRQGSLESTSRRRQVARGAGGAGRRRSHCGRADVD